MKDKQGREYAKLSQLKVGDYVVLDNGFTCHERGKVKLKADVDGGLYFPCNGGEEKKSGPYRRFHFLDGQLMDDGDSLVGIYYMGHYSEVA